MTKQPFSRELESWLSSSKPKTIHDLETVFEERSFAITILLLMFVPALPIPTGGVTHIFELIVMILAVEMMIGRKTIWLPRRWRKAKLSPIIKDKALPFIMRRIRWFERYSRPRLENYLDNQILTRFAGLLFFILAFSAAAAVPFSGLDTLPSLGAVIIALSLLLGDAVLLPIGIIIGSVGIGLEIALGAATLEAFKHFI